MTIDGTDDVVKGEVLRRSKTLQADGTKFHRGVTVLTSGVPSIPSRYLTISTSNSEKRGFQQTAKRFHNDMTDTPGPGEYQLLQSLDKQLEKTSDSKKGSGSFASKSKRDFVVDGMINVPAPTSYNITGKFGQEHQDFNRVHCSSMFQKPIAEQTLSSRSSFPAPNQYDIDQGMKKVTKSNNVTAQAAFRSHTKRVPDPDKHFISPAPGSYNVDDSVTRSLPPIHRSSFKSTSKRDIFSLSATSNLPGPADYRPFEKSDDEPHRQLFPRHNYLVISAPAIPPPPDDPLPGPGAYEIRDFKGFEKKYMSSAVFVSNSSRWNFDPMIDPDRPGPGSYTPRPPAKQSFNYNIRRKWLI